MSALQDLHTISGLTKELTELFQLEAALVGIEELTPTCQTLRVSVGASEAYTLGENKPIIKLMVEDIIRKQQAKIRHIRALLDGISDPEPPPTGKKTYFSDL